MESRQRKVNTCAPVLPPCRAEKVWVRPRRQHVGGAMDLRIESLLTDVAALGRKEID
jgi:hypothetical protein